MSGSIHEQLIELLSRLGDRDVAKRHARMIAERTPGLRRADIFARQKREGWDCWGDEAGKSSTGGIISASKKAGVRP